MLGRNGLAVVPLLCSLAGAAQRDNALSVNVIADHCPLTLVSHVRLSPGRISRQPSPTLLQDLIPSAVCYMVRACCG